MNAAHPRFPLFDSLRAIAALAVVAFHIAYFTGNFGGDGASRWLSQLNVGVTIFFLVSGFLLYRPFAQARFAGTDPPPVVPYAVRRFFRIVPAYWLALIGLGLWLGIDAIFTVEGLFWYFGFLQVYNSDAILAAAGAGHIWTLCVEVTFYLMLPFWALALRRVPFEGKRGFVLTEGTALAVAFLGALAFRLLVSDYDAEGRVLFGNGQVTLPAFLDHFALGMGLAVASVVTGADARVRGRALGWPLAFAAFLALGLVSNVEGLTGDLLRHELKGLVALGVLIPAIWVAERSASARVLGWRPLLWVGVVSYGLYLWHLVVLREMLDAGVQDSLGLAGLTASVLAGSLLLAAASWYGLERWALAFARRITKRPTTEPALPELRGEAATSR